ncbi:hypothetical protein LCGC14_2853780, partial [marine sediment metagenome]
MTTKGVTESKTGTMSETDGQLKPPSNEDKIPGGVKVSPEDTPKFSQKQFDDAIHSAKSETGRTVKALEVREQAVKDSEAKEANRQNVRDAKEIEDAAGDTEKLSAIRLRQDARSKLAEAERIEKETDAKIARNQVEIDAAKETRLGTDISAIAEKHKV